MFAMPFWEIFFGCGRFRFRAGFVTLRASMTTMEEESILEQREQHVALRTLRKTGTMAAGMLLTVAVVTVFSNVWSDAPNTQASTVASTDLKAKVVHPNLDPRPHPESDPDANTLIIRC